MRKHMYVIVSHEPNCSEEPLSGNYACVLKKGEPESAVRLFWTGRMYQLYINGSLRLYTKWQDMTRDHPFGLTGRMVRSDEYNRILRERLQDIRDGSIVQLDPMVHPAPTF